MHDNTSTDVHQFLLTSALRRAVAELDAAEQAFAEARDDSAFTARMREARDALHEADAAVEQHERHELDARADAMLSGATESASVAATDLQQARNRRAVAQRDLEALELAKSKRAKAIDAAKARLTAAKAVVQAELEKTVCARFEDMLRANAPIIAAMYRVAELAAIESTVHLSPIGRVRDAKHSVDALAKRRVSCTLPKTDPFNSGAKIFTGDILPPEPRASSFGWSPTEWRDAVIEAARATNPSKRTRKVA